jgi:hypothetical protein
MPGGSTLEVFQSAAADSLAPGESDAAIPSGYGEGVYEGLRYGVTVRKSRDGNRTSLFARAIADGDVVSFNLYRLRSGEDSLRPVSTVKSRFGMKLHYRPRLGTRRASESRARS